MSRPPRPEELETGTLLVTVPTNARYQLFSTSSAFDADHRFAARIGRQVWFAFGPTAEAAMLTAIANYQSGLDNGDAPEANRQLQLRDLVDA